MANTNSTKTVRLAKNAETNRHLADAIIRAAFAREREAAVRKGTLRPAAYK